VWHCAAPLELQLSVAAPPVLTLLGLAIRLTVGGAGLEATAVCPKGSSRHTAAREKPTPLCAIPGASPVAVIGLYSVEAPRLARHAESDTKMTAESVAVCTRRQRVPAARCYLGVRAGVQRVRRVAT